MVCAASSTAVAALFQLFVDSRERPKGRAINRMCTMPSDRTQASQREARGEREVKERRRRNKQEAN